MIENNNSEINVQDLMLQIRDEVARKKMQATGQYVNTTQYTDEGIVFNRLPENKVCIADKPKYTVTEFLEYQDDDFIRSAYRGIFRREPDPSGYDHYGYLLYTGQMSKIEILGRLRYSAEGRSYAVPVRGLLKPFLASTAFRLPVLGAMAAIAIAFFKLPSIVRNQVSFENYTYRHQRKHVEQINIIADQIESAISQMQQTIQEVKHQQHEQKNIIADQIESAISQMQQTIQEIKHQQHDQKHNILDQHRRLALLLEEARKGLPETFSKKQLSNIVAEEDYLLDAFYVSFEDQFRGTRAAIKQCVGVYLPLLNDADVGTAKAPILDIGCGRGEWLELLKEQDLIALGVDSNHVMVSQCQELGLEVINSDALDYLRTLNNNSLGAVTGMHIIEHIPFKGLIALFDEVLRVLKPGGMAIFETPNPENLIVGACNFYYDPTHIKPLPPEPMRFVMEARGFGSIEILRLHPYPEEAMLNEGSEQLKEIVNRLMYGPRDYALIAYKA
jgi:O-antigen chain-terminating methyltransferase